MQMETERIELLLKAEGDTEGFKWQRDEICLPRVCRFTWDGVGRELRAGLYHTLVSQMQKTEASRSK